MRTFYLVLALLFVPNGAFSGSFFVIPADYEKLNSPRPEIRLSNPFPTINGTKINGVRFGLDSSWSERSCILDERAGDAPCNDALITEPGPHVVGILACSRSDCHGMGEAWKWRFKINVGRREKIAIDVSKLAQLNEWPTDPKQIESLLVRTPMKGQKLSPCGEAIEKAFYTDTCRAEGFKSLLGQMRNMHKICAKDWSENTDLILEMAIWTAAFTTPRRCYADTSRLSRFLVEWHADDNFWPPQTVSENKSSWAWARSTGDGETFWKYSGKEFRKRAFAMVKRWYFRQMVVDQLIDAQMDPDKNLGRLLAATANAKTKTFDLNPARPWGHRNFALSVLAHADRKIKTMPKASETIAEQVIKKGATSGKAKVHCGLKPEASNLVWAFTEDDELTHTEWKAALTILNNTPADKSLGDCGLLAHSSIKCPIGIEARLTAIAKVDCNAARSKDLRGKSIKQVLEHHSNAKLSNTVLAELQKSFGECLQ